MMPARFLSRSSRAFRAISRPSARAFSAYTPRFADEKQFEELNKRAQDTSEEHRKRQTEKPLNPHFTNTTSTIANEMPSIGKDAPPPELISSVDKDYQPKDAVPENTHRMTGGTQGSKDEHVSGANAGIEGGQTQDGELGVGELEGAKFRVEPLRRTGEDEGTMRARLLYQSRKRGTLESDLLLSTFADTNLAHMSASQLQQYDLFLDENDWDIYYWATQEPTPTSLETAEGAAGKDEWKRSPASGEWAQTVGTFKPAYRPVPRRWEGSEILGLLREHVRSRSAGEGRETGGLGMMPEIKTFDA